MIPFTTLVGPRRGRALVSYITHPFMLPPNHPDSLRFSNIGLARGIVESLLGLGFDVDVIDYDDMSFVPDGTYDLWIAHGGINFQRLDPLVGEEALRIYFSTGSYWQYHNDREAERFAALRERRGASLPADRHIAVSEELPVRCADAVICLGNEAVAETYAGLPHVIRLDSAAVPDEGFSLEGKDFAAARDHFLMFGSAGCVHKGLDILLESFAGDDAHLWICGGIEPAFAEAYAAELALPTIHQLGWVQQRSERFYELMRTCGSAILPSSSEGQPGGIIECLHRGLLPIVSRDCHVDVGDYGVMLEECSATEIRAAIAEVRGRPAEWHAQAARHVLADARQRYVPERFVADFSRTLETVIRRGRTRRMPVEVLAGPGDGVAVAAEPSRIVIDAVFFQFNDTGIARVWRSLLEEWSGTAFGRHVVVLDRAGTAPRIPGIEYRDVRPFQREDVEADRTMLEEVCRQEQAALFASTYYTYPRRTPSLFVAYDMIPEVMGFDLREPDWRRKQEAIRHASAFIAISHNTADDLARLFPDAVRRDEVAVAPCGVGETFSRPTEDEVAEYRRRTGCPKEFYVFVGSRAGYKNFSLLAQAFPRVARETGAGLLLVGGSPRPEPEFLSLLAGLNVTGGPLADAELRLAYGAATALVFPSRYEGFGLPILEAMACGCPVITCRNASIPEVAGDAAIYVDDEDPWELGEAMRQLRRHKVRERYRAAGLERVKEFTWSRMAEIVAAKMLETRGALDEAPDTAVDTEGGSREYA